MGHILSLFRILPAPSYNAPPDCSLGRYGLMPMNSTTCRERHDAAGRGAYPQVPVPVLALDLVARLSHLTSDERSALGDEAMCARDKV